MKIKIRKPSIEEICILSNIDCLLDIIASGVYINSDTIIAKIKILKKELATERAKNDKNLSN